VASVDGGDMARDTSIEGVEGSVNSLQVGR
jgi:hypothetical protein